jgi:hypothetical protein
MRSAKAWCESELLVHCDLIALAISRMILPYLAAVLLALATAYSAIMSFRQKPQGAAPSLISPDGAKRPARILVGLATLIVVIGLGAWFSINTRSSTQRSLRFLIPEGYSGWVRVEFEIPGAPPLPQDAGRTVVKIPSSGSLKTSSPEQYGWAKDSYAFYSSAGERPIPDSGAGRLIWGKINGEASGSSGRRKYEEFFVGTQQQFKDQVAGMKPGN